MGNGMQKGAAGGKKFRIWAQFCVLFTGGVHFLFRTFITETHSQIKMGWVRSTYGGEKGCIQGFGGET